MDNVLKVNWFVQYKYKYDTNKEPNYYYETLEELRKIWVLIATENTKYHLERSQKIQRKNLTDSKPH